MAIITISRGSYSKGKEVAERVGERLGYEVISRDVLLSASEHFNIPEVKLVRALHDAPSILDRFSRGRETYIAYIENAILERVRSDNIVYHGLAGHFFLKGVGHLLKVRIVADMEMRVLFEMEREKISREDALRIIKKDDEERRRWSMNLYGVDPADSGLYDLIIHIRKITVNDAVEMICHAAKLPPFLTTPESQQTLDDLVLASRVKAKLSKNYSHLTVVSKNGVVFVDVDIHLTQKLKSIMEREILAFMNEVEGVKEVKINVPGSGSLYDG